MCVLRLEYVSIQIAKISRAQEPHVGSGLVLGPRRLPDSAATFCLFLHVGYTLQTLLFASQATRLGLGKDVAEGERPLFLLRS